MAGDALPTDKSVGYYLSSLWDYGPLGLHLNPSGCAPEVLNPLQHAEPERPLGLSDSNNGKLTMNVAPLPSVLSKRICPP